MEDQQRGLLTARIQELERVLLSVTGDIQATVLSQNAEQLQRVLIQLKRKYNTLVPILRLPVELSAMILFWCMRYRLSEDSQEAIINLSHTCHAWRIFTLSLPSVWTKIDSDDLSYVRACVERSQKLPLTIRCTEHTFPAVRQEFHRIVHLDLSCSSLRGFLESVEPSDRDFSSLVVLSLSDGHAYDWNDEPTLPQEVTIIPWVLSHELPRLRDLSLAYHSHLRLQWWKYPEVFSRLTHLSLVLVDQVDAYHTKMPTEDRCTFTRVLACLKQLRSLESLILHNALPRLGEEREHGRIPTLPEYNPFSMPRLVYIHLETTMICAIHLLRNLHLPSTASISIVGEIYDFCFKETGRALSFIMPFIRGENTFEFNEPVVSFGIHPYATDHADLSCFFSRQYVESDDMLRTECNLEFNVWPVHQVEPSIVEICRRFEEQLRSIEALSLRKMDMDLDIFFALFKDCLNLRWLGITETDTLLLPDILVTKYELHDGEHGHLFPLLEAVTISSTTLRGSASGGIENDRWFSDLVNAIRYRKKQGLGPMRVTFEDCFNVEETDEYLKSLSSLVTVSIDAVAIKEMDEGTYANNSNPPVVFHEILRPGGRSAVDDEEVSAKDDDDDEFVGSVLRDANPFDREDSPWSEDYYL